MSTAVMNSAVVLNTNDALSPLPTTIEWLMIASENDSEVVERIRTALGDNPAAILTIPDASPIDSPKVQSAIQTLLDSGTITHVFLVGSSPAPPQLEDSASALPESASAVADRLLAGAVAESDHNHANQQQFKEAVQTFLNSSSIQPLWESRSAAMGGLLYRECDAVFLLFDPDTDRFVPLAATL